MKLFTKMKDGGPESTVTGYWLIEYKPLFSIVLLKFEGKSRDAFHTHAFNSLSWLISGQLFEQFLKKNLTKSYFPSIMPFITRKDDFHKVDSIGTSWVLSFRGPWAKEWKEFSNNEEYSLSDGRVKIPG